MTREQAIEFYESVCKHDEHINFDWKTASTEKSTFLNRNTSEIIEDEKIYFIKNVTKEDLEDAGQIIEESDNNGEEQ